MNNIKRIWGFLGSVYFAIILILLTAIFVIAGTVIESHSTSHLYAVYLIYHHPIFILLLWGFFCNILISTCRRWPFRAKHTPFIITHIGLLMILGGVLFKNYRGKQGAMTLLEGSGQDEISIQNPMAINIEKKSIHGSPWENAMIPLNLSRIGKLLEVKTPSTFKDLKIELLGFYPHSRQTVETWIKGDYCVISGLPPIPAHPFDPKEKFEKISTKIRLFPSPSPPCDLIALKAKNPQTAFETVYTENYTNPLLEISSRKEDPCGIPTLLFVEDESKHVYLYAFDAHGHTYSEVFKQENPARLVVYDQGFKGYSQWADLPFSPHPLTKQELKERKLALLKADLQKAEDQSTALCLPLELLRKACKDNSLDFSDISVSFLSQWNTSQALLLPDNYSLEANLLNCMESLDWDGVPEEIQQGCYWTSFILEELDKKLSGGSDIWTCLKQMKWPLLDDLQPENSSVSEIDSNTEVLHRLIRQIFYISPYLPPPPAECRANRKWLCSLLLLHGIHVNSISIPPEEPSVPVKIECPLSFKYEPIPPTSKFEDNIPLIHIKITEHGVHDSIFLRYDGALNGLKQPVLHGKYLVRFQPLFEKIPYRVRLRQARQIYYPDSQQPYSFESDVIITDKERGNIQETTLSMNHVYETWDGYRFYLANMTPSEVGSVKRVQIIVNLDPAKYWLTYPGGIMVVVGSLLLLWFRPYSKSSKK